MPVAAGPIDVIGGACGAGVVSGRGDCEVDGIGVDAAGASAPGT